MNFLPDVYVPCDVCRGKRYNLETLQVRYRGKSIADLLESTVEQALATLENIPQVKVKLCPGDGSPTPGHSTLTWSFQRIVSQ